MKAIHFIPPALALVAVGLWLNTSWGELTELRGRINAVRHQKASSSPRETEPSRNNRVRPAREAAAAKPAIRWQRIAELKSEGSHGILSKQELLRAEMRIRAMNPDELRDALAELTSQEMDQRIRSDLQAELLTVLAEKDPAGALDLLTGRNGILISRVNFASNMLVKWARKDPTAAVSWLDAKIAAGDFKSTSLKGGNHQRTEMEMGLLTILIGSDPEAAAARLSDLPQEQRSGVLSQFADIMRRKDGGIPENELSSFAAIVRSSLPADQQIQMITGPVGSLAGQPGYDKIDQYLEQVAASPAERTSSVREAADVKFRSLANNGRLTVEEIDRFRSWAASQSPETVDQITADSLTKLCWNGSSSAPKAWDLAIHYHQQTGNDKILSQFVRSAPGAFGKEKLLSMVELIKDEEIRKETVRLLQNNPFATP